MAIKFDMSGLEKGLNEAALRMKQIKHKSLETITDEVMRLSTLEVPHDTGMLQTSLGKEPEGDDTIIVGYNKVYAARLHEHPEYKFKKGRKGKFLIDPIMHNLRLFKRFMDDALNEGFI